nr:unnamed protein product [Callosobruchus analis]
MRKKRSSSEQALEWRLNEEKRRFLENEDTRFYKAMYPVH